jgi:non-homologous end joining protein Ku
MPSIVCKGHLTFGLVSIPVKLYRAARRERVRLHYVHRQEPDEAPAVRQKRERPQRSQEMDVALKLPPVVGSGPSNVFPAQGR